MSNIKKLMMTAAGGDALNVEDVFSTYVYVGNGSTQTITNGIDLSGEGGLVWTKQRTGATSSNVLVDTERGTNAVIYSDLTNAEYNTGTNTLTAFNNNGYDLGSNTNFNRNNEDNVSWTFRKAPKFFDVVTYTGNNVNNRAIPHNLGTTPGFIITKATSTAGYNWIVYHKDLSTNGYLFLDLTNAEVTAGLYSSTPTGTNFYISSNNNVNKTGTTYVSYLFAHHDGTGTFGPDGDEDIIHCGSYTGTGYPNTTTVDLGFEPEWVIIKRTDGTGAWFMLDTTRAWGDGPNQSIYGTLHLEANSSNQETASYFSGKVKITANGFKLYHNSYANLSGANYIYMAIRKGNKAVEAATDVFAPVSYNASNNPKYYSGFKADMAFARYTSTDDTEIYTRTAGIEELLTNSDAIATNGSLRWDHMNGLQDGLTGGSSFYVWMWKRARGFFDVVLYDGEGSGSNTNMKDHNLKAKPDMIWVKRRTTSATNWVVWHKDMDDSSLNDYTNRWTMRLNLNSAATDNNGYWAWAGSGYTADMNETQFSVGYSGMDWTNNTNSSYVAYLFASQDGISKVGYYTGTGSDQTIDCGFSSGARFVLVKRVDASGNWYFWDTARGIVSSADDKSLKLDTNNAQVNANDIEPHNSGFTIKQNTANANVLNGHYIFYAIA